MTHYTSSLTLDNPAINHLLYSNRAACYLLLNERGKSLKDGRSCVEAMPDFGKGWGRVAAAEFALGRFKDAAKSYLEGVRVEEKKPEEERKGVGSLREGWEKALKKEEERAKRQEVEDKRKREEEERREREEMEMEKSLAENDDKDNDDGATKKPQDDGDLMADFFSDLTETTTETVVKKINKPQEKYTNQDLSPFDNASVISSILAPNYKWKNLNPFRVFRLGIDANPEVSYIFPTVYNCIILAHET